jgi:hypothetical protein
MVEKRVQALNVHVRLAVVFVEQRADLCRGRARGHQRQLSQQLFLGIEHVAELDQEHLSQ